MNAAYDVSFYQGLPCLVKHNASVTSCGAWPESVLFKSTCTAQLLFLIAERSGSVGRALDWGSKDC